MNYLIFTELTCAKIYILSLIIIYIALIKDKRDIPSQIMSYSITEDIKCNITHKINQSLFSTDVLFSGCSEEKKNMTMNHSGVK